MEDELRQRIEKMLPSYLRYKRKIDPETLDERYEKSVRLSDLRQFNEEELDFVFKYLDSKDILVFGASPILYSDYPNYRFLKKSSRPVIEKVEDKEETEKLLVEYNSLQDEDKKIEIRNQIIEKNMQLIKCFARRFSSYTGIEEGMFEGAACIGFIQAIDSYKTGTNKFYSYVVETIRGYLLRELSFLYDISSRLYFEINDSRKELENILGYNHIDFKEYGDEIIRLYALENNCSDEEILALKSKLFSQVPAFLDENLADPKDELEIALDSICKESMREDFGDVLKKFSDEEQDIVRRLNGLEDYECETLRGLGKEYKVTYETVRRKAKKVYKKMSHNRKIKSYREVM